MLGPTRSHQFGGSLDPAPCRHCKKPLHEHDAWRRCADGVRRFSKAAEAKAKRLEANDQADVVAHLRELGELVIRCEQGAKRKYGAARDKALGVQTGAPDLIWVRPSGAVIWIECKKSDGELSPEQIALHAVLRRMGHVVITGYGQADLIRQVDALRSSHP